MCIAMLFVGSSQLSDPPPLIYLFLLFIFFSVIKTTGEYALEVLDDGVTSK